MFGLKACATAPGFLLIFILNQDFTKLHRPLTCDLTVSDCGVGVMTDLGNFSLELSNQALAPMCHPNFVFKVTGEVYLLFCVAVV